MFFSHRSFYRPLYHSFYLGVQRGFTLLEIMVVVVILGILATIAAPYIMDNPDQARITKAQADINTISQALQLYKLKSTRYPTTEQGLQALVTRPKDLAQNLPWSKQMNEVPKDPWGHEYYYISPGEKNKDYDIYSLGADGAPGGEGADADIGNWNTESNGK